MVKFSGASIASFNEKTYLMLELPDYTNKQKAIKFCGEILNKMYVAAFKVYREKRSLEANNYAWCLIGKLAEVLMMNPEDIYRRHVREVGKFQQYLMRNDAYTEFSEGWEEGHIGRFAKVIGESREKEGFVWVAVYFGSSDFDTREMSVFIDNLIQECKQQDIEYLPPNEIERMLTAWERNEPKR